MPDNWKAPSRTGRPRFLRRREAPDDSETLGTRLLAIVVAIPVFEFSLYAGLALICTDAWLGASVWSSLPSAFHAVYCGLALVVAGVAGLGGLTSLLGHLFNTHFAGEAKPRLTIGLWAGLALVTGLAYWLAVPAP
jgi:hypothetical protein